MGLFSRLFNEFVDVIEWTDDSSDTMVYRFERYGNEIKYGAKLIVRESQIAVFVNEGEIADVLGAGTYELETRNLPVLTTLQHWDHGFKSPFKAEVYFCNARRFTDLKWGTKQPLMLRDAEFGGLRLRAFGTYSVRITEAATFLREIVGTEGIFTTDEISNQLRNLITSRFATIIGGANIPILDLAANYDQLGEFLTRRIAPEFGEYGLELTRLLVENISLPQSVSEALDKRTSMGMTGNLDQYLQYQTGVALESSGAGGAAGAGVGMGAGMGVGMAMADRMSTGGAGRGGSGQTGGQVVGKAPDVGVAAGHSPPPLPSAADAAGFHLSIDGAQRGPLAHHELQALAQQGKLTAATLVWRTGMDGWQPAGEVPTLISVLGSNALAGRSTPPPLPTA